MFVENHSARKPAYVGNPRHFQQYFSYIVVVSFIGGEKRSTRWKPAASHWQTLSHNIDLRGVARIIKKYRHKLFRLSDKLDSRSSLILNHWVDFTPLIRAYEREGGFSRYIGPRPGDTRRGPWISEEPQSLSHRRFILIFSFFGG